MKTPKELAHNWSRERTMQPCANGYNMWIMDEWRLAEEAFIAGYQAAAPQWISVKDRLPENISDVLILSKEKESCVGYYRSSDNDWNMYNPCCSFHMELHGVTHWMPLPEAPKEE
jgi:hypothetical protein